MTAIITSDAIFTPIILRSKRKSGIPISPPLPKQTSCLKVNPNKTLLLIFVKSFGTGTYAIIITATGIF